MGKGLYPHFIGVWLSDVQRTVLDELAAEDDYNRSKVIRQLLAEALLARAKNGEIRLRTPANGGKPHPGRGKPPLDVKTVHQEPAEARTDAS